MVTNSSGDVGATGRSGGCSCCRLHFSRKPPGISMPQSEWKMRSVEPLSDITGATSVMLPLSAKTRLSAAAETGSL